MSRTRQLYPEALFEAVFDKVFSLCVANKMVADRRVAIDPAPVKVNASPERLLEKQPNLPGPRLVQSVEDQNKVVDSRSEPSNRQAASVIAAADHRLRRLKKYQQNLKRAPTILGAGNEKAKLLSNKTHYSPTDPEARISIKPGKARKLNYHRPSPSPEGGMVIGLSRPFSRLYNAYFQLSYFCFAQPVSENRCSKRSCATATSHL
ncbi:hypothetical protein [Larkinella rosea]|uniref:hypothetical protein n=1 Tax=Larkinella rosea TaxID=2025312 RepID=UPI001E32C7A6|nr:hypothetical protein [Larkinella rosea]